jgi:HEAT repeat protein
MKLKLTGAALVILLSVSVFAQEEPKEPAKPEEPAGELVEQLKGGDWRTRETAQRKLLTKDASVIEKLKPALEDENFEVRFRAKQVVEAIEARSKAVRLLGYLIGKDDASDALKEIQEKVKHPIARLSDPRATARVSLATELGQSKARAALPLLVHLLGDNNEAVQDAALQALTNFEDKKRAKLLLRAVEKGELLLKCRALLALGKLHETKSTGEVAKYLDSKIVFLRLAAVESLDFMRSREAAKHLIKAVKDSHERVRWNAADAFTRVKCKAAVEPLIEAIGAKTAKIMTKEEIKQLNEVLVPAGFRILEGEEARLQKYLPRALIFQTGQTHGDDTDKWREWWKANNDFYDDDMKRKEIKVK